MNPEMPLSHRRRIWACKAARGKGFAGFQRFISAAWSLRLMLLEARGSRRGALCVWGCSFSRLRGGGTRGGRPRRRQEKGAPHHQVASAAHPSCRFPTNIPFSCLCVTSAGYAWVSRESGPGGLEGALWGRGQRSRLGHLGRAGVRGASVLEAPVGGAVDLEAQAHRLRPLASS